MSQPVIITAAIIAIGDELLSGRTKDKNIGHLAEKLNDIGIDLKEVRIIGDEEEMIVTTVQALKARYDYVFTSGGIGPTHDDITADAIAKAFGRPCLVDPRADKLLTAFYAARGVEYTESRRRMARMPQGAELIANSVSTAPGFIVDNVYVLAGVPAVFQVMVDEVLPGLKKGTPILSRTMTCPFGEGVIGHPLAEIQQQHPNAEIGSYPHYEGSGFSLELVIRARDNMALNSAYEAVEAMIDELQRRQNASLPK